MVEYPEASSIRFMIPPELVLEDIVHTVVERVHPRRIILIGSRARGDARPDSDYDVVVELDADAKTADRCSNEIYGFFSNRRWSLNVIPRTRGQIERSANDPGTIDWDIVREGKLLYAAEGAETLLSPPPPLRISEKAPSDQLSVLEWAERAERDLRMAHRVMGMGDAWEYVCFLSQQAAEKYLKALLARRLVRPGRTHNLNQLLLFLKGTGVHLSGLQADCTLLGPLVVKARYGSLVQFDEEIARAALAAAERIAAAVTPLLD